MPQTLKCKNPDCNRRFTPDSEHRFGAACCKLCAQAIARQQTTGTRFVWQSPYSDQNVIARPTPTRKHGRDKREASNE